VATLNVDVEAVRALADRLRRLSSEFASLGEEIGWFEGALGSRRVADALGDFATNWSHAKEALRTELDELAAGADGAAAAYAAAEERIAAGMSREQP